MRICPGLTRWNLAFDSTPHYSGTTLWNSLARAPIILSHIEPPGNGQESNKKARPAIYLPKASFSDRPRQLASLSTVHDIRSHSPAEQNVFLEALPIPLSQQEGKRFIELHSLFLKAIPYNLSIQPELSVVKLDTTFSHIRPASAGRRLSHNPLPTPPPGRSKYNYIYATL